MERLFRMIGAARTAAPTHYARLVAALNAELPGSDLARREFRRDPEFAAICERIRDEFRRDASIGHLSMRTATIRMPIPVYELMQLEAHDRRWSLNCNCIDHLLTPVGDQ